MPVYKDKQRGTWYYQINFKDQQGNYKQKRKSGFDTKRAAKEAEYLKSLELDHNPSTDLTFKDLYHHYFTFIESRIKYSSLYSKKNLSSHHILPYFQDKRVSNITSKDIIKWQQDMSKRDYAYEYLSKIYVNLSAIFQHGVKHYGVKTNPCKLVGNFKNPGEVDDSINFWTYEQFKQFISFADDIGFFTFFTFLYYTGARKGEALALTWNDIDFDKREVNIYKSVAEKSKQGGGISIGPPKTKSSVRRVLISTNLTETLKNHYTWCKHYEGFSDQSFVFGVNRPFSSSSIYRRFNSYVKSAKIERIKIHDLRHSHASLLINSGASILVVSKRLGHKNTKETLDTYSHMFPNKEKEAVDLIDNL